MPECQNTGKKISPASAFLWLVNCVSPALAIRHYAQSGNAGHGLVRHCPAMSFAYKIGELSIMHVLY
jgi:hypothetical protein